MFVGREGDDAVLRVADQGIGIPADMLPKIFDLFVQAHHTIDRTRGGLGIGLTLVRRLAELHGGTRACRERRRWPRLDVHRAHADGRGAESGRATRRPPMATAMRRAARSNRAACCWWTTTTIRARCIARCCARMATMCAKRRMASARWRCCSSAHDRPLDVAFIDIGLPGGMDGYELARRIRSLPTGRDVRLVALTGYGFPEDRQQSKHAGFARHLVKPVEPEALQRELTPSRLMGTLILANGDAAQCLLAKGECTPSTCPGAGRRSAWRRCRS